MSKITLNGTELYPTRYATGEDLQGKAFTLEIARIEIERMTNPRTHTEAEKPVIYFKNARRGFVLGKTFAETIADALHETDAAKWTGKRVEIYPEQTRLGVGVRARRAPNGETPAPELADEDEE